jgi:polysaccharide biosynthesis/export protein
MNIQSLIRRVSPLAVALSLFAAAFLVVLTGCKTTNTHATPNNGGVTQGTNDVVLREGDKIKVDFPGNPQLESSSAMIRVDGKITLPVIGEVMVAGKTPDQLRQDLVQRYAKELVSSKDIAVTVISSSYTVYVMGSVSRPGKVTADHPLTAVEAIMEAGGYDVEKAQLKSVKVVRTINGKTHTYMLNLKGLQSPGAPVDNFSMQNNDIIIIPQRFVPF